MIKVHFILHEVFEGPGAYAVWATERNCTVTWSRLYEGDVLPGSVDHFDLLIVMGGPQSADTTPEECPHFDATKEKAFISTAIAAGKAVVGVCLGSQLLGAALGAKHERSPNKEIGSFPITITPEGRANAKFAHFGAGLVVGHWHGDMPGLTSTAKIMATSAGCPRQVVEYSPLVYGFQCHLEFNAELIDLLIAASPELPNLIGPGHSWVQQADTLRSNDHTAANAALFGFLDTLSQAYLSKADVKDLATSFKVANQ